VSRSGFPHRESPSACGWLPSVFASTCCKPLSRVSVKALAAPGNARADLLEICIWALSIGRFLHRQVCLWQMLVNLLEWAPSENGGRLKIDGDIQLMIAAVRESASYHPSEMKADQNAYLQTECLVYLVIVALSWQHGIVTVSPLRFLPIECPSLKTSKPNEVRLTS